MGIEEEKQVEVGEEIHVFGGGGARHKGMLIKTWLCGVKT